MEAVDNNALNQFNVEKAILIGCWDQWPADRRKTSVRILVREANRCSYK